MFAQTFTSFLFITFFVTTVHTARYLVMIMNGRSTRIFPYHVALEYDDEYHCGGAIVSSRYALTAAHCFSDINPKKLTIRSGSPYRERGGVVHQIQNFTTHPDFRMDLFQNAHNDIAVICVVEPFRDDFARGTIKLFEQGEQVRPGSVAVVSGWGVTETRDLSDKILFAEVPVVNKTECDKKYRPYGGIKDGEICAGVKGTGSWHGDSGGPLVVGNRLAGIVSYGEGNKVPEVPGVFSEVGFYRTWINQHVEFDREKPRKYFPIRIFRI